MANMVAAILNEGAEQVVPVILLIVLYPT